MARGAAALREAGVAAVGDVTNGLGSRAPPGPRGDRRHRSSTRSTASPRVERPRRCGRRRGARDRAGDPGPGPARGPEPARRLLHPPRRRRRAARRRAGVDPPRRGPGGAALRGRGAPAPSPTSSLRLGLEPGALRPFARSAVDAVAPWLGPETLVVHAVDLDDEDLAALRRSGATVVLCPRSNRHISGRLPDLPRLLAAGIPLAVGTDSLASSPSLSPLEELAVLHAAFPDGRARAPPRARLERRRRGRAGGGAARPGVGPRRPRRAARAAIAPGTPSPGSSRSPARPAPSSGWPATGRRPRA